MKQAGIALGLLLSWSACFGCAGTPRIDAVRRLSDRLDDFGAQSSNVPSEAPVSFDGAKSYLKKARQAARDGDSLEAERFAHLGLIQLEMAVLLAKQMKLEDELEKRCAAGALLEERMRALEERIMASTGSVPAPEPFVCPAAE